MNNFPCICGHSKEEHGISPFTNENWCSNNNCGYKSGNTRYHLFKQDNLKYLEQQYEKNAAKGAV